VIEPAAVTSSLTGGHRVVAVSGEIDVHSGPVLREHLLDLIAHHESEIVVDLSEVSFLDSSGLGVLVTAHKRARALGGHLRLAACRPAVADIFQITALDKAFPMYDSVDDALAAAG
jgi:anti-sigma B factor antagonist